MARESLFNAVKQLQEERKARHSDMLSFMRGLDGTGQVGYAIGYGLSRLFGGSAEAEQKEMEEAQAKNAYAETYMNTPAEYRPTVFKEGMRLFPDYAMQVREYQDDQDSAAAEAARTERLMQIKEQELRIKQAEAGQFDTKPLAPESQEFKGHKTRLQNMIKLMPEDHPIAQKIAKMNDSGEWYDFSSGLEDSDYIAIIDNAELLRRQNKANNMTMDDALKLSLSNYVSGGQVAVDAQSESQARTQRHIEMFNKAAD